MRRRGVTGFGRQGDHVPVFVVVKRRSYGGLGIGYLTEEIRTRTILRIQEVVDEAECVRTP